MNATVVAHNLEIVFPNGGGIVDVLNVGSLYYGQTRSLECRLVNNGPVPASFTACIHAYRSSSDDKAKPDAEERYAWLYTPQSVAQAFGSCLRCDCQRCRRPHTVNSCHPLS